MELIVVTGRAVVVRFNALDREPAPLKARVAGLNPQLAPTGREAQVRETLAPYVCDGDTNTE